MPSSPSSFSVSNPGFCIDSLRRKYVGRVLSLEGTSPADKGAGGRVIEREFRSDPLLQLQRWSGLNESRPDMGVWEIKTVSLVESSAGWRVKHDLAVGMLSPSMLESKTLPESLKSKLKMVLVGVSRTASEVKIHDIRLLDLTEDSLVAADFQTMGRSFSRRVRSGCCPDSALAKMGAASGAYGPAAIPKPKDSSSNFSHRRRGFYVRRSYLQRRAFQVE